MLQLGPGHSQRRTQADATTGAHTPIRSAQYAHAGNHPSMTSSLKAPQTHLTT